MKRLIILLLIVGCGLFDKTYKCELDGEELPTFEFGKLCNHSVLQVDAIDIDEAEEYCYDWFEIDSLNNVDNSNCIFSCNCEVFN